MNSSVVDKLLQSGIASSQTISAGETLFRLGDVCQHYVIVQQGTVRVELLSSTGHQLLLYRIEDGQSCAMTTSCLLGDSLYFAQAISETPIELIMIKQSVFNQHLAESSEFRDFVFSGFHERFARLMSRTAELATNTVDQRLAAALLAYSETSDASGTIEQTHQQLSVDIGSAREVVSRRLSVFEQKGFIKKSRGEIVITNIEHLQNMLKDV